MRDLILLVETMSTRDGLISASSEFSIYVARQVRTNGHLNSTYGWTPDVDDREPWVQFNMEQVVTVWGVVVMLSGNDPNTEEKITSLKVAASGDGVKWNDVSDVMFTNYNKVDRGMFSTSWFKKASQAQYWRINVLAWQNRISMQADLIGQIP